jgi:hypothetical protein
MTPAVDDGAVLVGTATPEIMDFPNWMVWLIQLAATCLVTFAMISLLVMLGVALHQLLDSEDRRSWPKKDDDRQAFFDQDRLHRP